MVQYRTTGALLRNVPNGSAGAGAPGHVESLPPGLETGAVVGSVESSGLRLASASAGTRLGAGVGAGVSAVEGAGVTGRASKQIGGLSSCKSQEMVGVRFKNAF